MGGKQIRMRRSVIDYHKLGAKTEQRAAIEISVRELPGRVWVNGYTRADGRVVSGHFRNVQKFWNGGRLGCATR